MAYDNDLALEAARIGFTLDPEPDGEEVGIFDMPSDNGYGPLPDAVDLASLDDTPVSSSPLRRRRTRASLELERSALDQQQADEQSVIPADGNEYLNPFDRVGLGLGQAGGMLKSQLGGIRTFLGNDVEGKPLSESGRRTQQEYADLGDVSGYNPVGDFIQDFTSEVAGSAAPSLVAGGLVAAGGAIAGAPLAAITATSLAGGAIVGAAQTAGAFMDDAVSAYESNGYSRTDSIKMARPVAALTGSITAALTVLMPGGAEAMVRKLATGKLSVESGAQLMREIVKEALSEFPEEFSDQLAQGFAERWTYNPNKSIGEIAMEAWHAGSLSSISVGGIGTVGGVGKAILSGDRAPGQAQLGAEAVPGPGGTETVDQVEQSQTQAPVQKTTEEKRAILLARGIQQARTYTPQQVEKVFSGFSPEYQEFPVQEPVLDEVPVAPPSRQTVIATRILTAAGFSPEFSKEFGAQFAAKEGSNHDSTGEDFRAALFAAAANVGAKPVESIDLLHENENDYVAMGFTPEQAAEYSRDAKVNNDSRRATQTTQNQAALAQYSAPPISAPAPASVGSAPSVGAETPVAAQVVGALPVAAAGEASLDISAAENEASLQRAIASSDRYLKAMDAHRRGEISDAEMRSEHDRNQEVQIARDKLQDDFYRHQTALRGNKTQVTQIPEPESFSSIDDLMAFRNQRLSEERALWVEQIGISPEEALRIQPLVHGDTEDAKITKNFTPAQRAKYEWFFEESDFNKRNGSWKHWNSSNRFNPESINSQDTAEEHAAAIVALLANRDSVDRNSDEFVFLVASAINLVQQGGSQKDLAKAVAGFVKRNSGASQADAAEYFKKISAKIGATLRALGIEIPVSPRPQVEAAPPVPTAPPLQGVSRKRRTQNTEANEDGAFEDVVVADVLAVGDRFKVKGREFEVTQMRKEPDGTTQVIVKDFSTLGTHISTVGFDSTWQIDKGSLKRAMPQVATPEASARRRALPAFSIPPLSRLSNLSDLPFSPAQKAVVDQLLSHGFDPKIRIVNDPYYRHVASYNGTDGMLLNWNKLNSSPHYALIAIVHEAVHDATHSAIRNRNNYETVDRLRTLMQYASEAYDSSDKKSKNFDHAFKNVDEFVTAAFASSNFRKFLAAIKLSDRSILVSVKRGSQVSETVAPSLKPVTVFQKFIDIVSKLLGFSTDGTLLAEVIISGEELIRSGIKADTQISYDAGNYNTSSSGLRFEPYLNGDGSLSETEQGQAPAPSNPESAKGIEAIKTLVQNSKLSDKSKRVALEVLSSPMFQREADFSNLQMRFSQDLPPGLMGLRNEWLIRVREDGGETVIPEELFHVLFDMLPADVMAELEAARQKALPADVPEAIRNGTASTADFLPSKEFPNGKYPKDLYQFRSASEFMAMMFSDKAARESVEPGVWGKVQQFFREMMQAIRRVTGLESAADRIYREMMSGQMKLSPEAMLSVEEEGSIGHSEEQARDIANLAKSKAAQEFQGKDLQGQSSAIKAVFDKVGGPFLQNPRLRKLFESSKWAKLAEVGERLAGAKLTYDQARAAVTEDFLRNEITRSAGQQVVRIDQIKQEAQALRKAAQDKVASPEWVNRISRANQALARKQTAESNLLIVRSVLNTAIAKAVEQQNKEKKSDVEIARQEGEIRGLDEARQSTPALERLGEDMVATLSKTTEGADALANGAPPRTIASLYKKTKLDLDEPVTNENLIRWMSYILSASKEARDGLHALHISRAPATAVPMNSFQGRLANDFKNNPVKTLKAILRDREKVVTASNKAEWAWLQLNKDITRELENINSDIEAGDFADAIDNDPDYQATRKQILSDQNAFIKTPAKPFQERGSAESTVMTPITNTVIDISTDYMNRGSRAEALADYANMQAGIFEYDQWLDDPANFDHPLRRLHEANRNTLLDYYGRAQMLTPSDSKQSVNAAFTIMNNLADIAKTRETPALRFALRRHDQFREWSARWNARWRPIFSDQRRLALKAHGFKTGDDIIRANNRWYDNIGNELYASWQNAEEPGLKVGDRTESGDVITQADFDDLIAQDKAMAESFNIVSRDRQVTEDTAGLKTGSNPRAASRRSKYVLPRRFKFEFKTFAKDIADAYRAFLDDPAKASLLEAALDKVFPQHAYSFVKDRHSNFAKTTIFDGPGRDFETLASRMIGNFRLRTVDSMANEISNISGVTPDEAKSVILQEFGQIVTGFSNAVETDLSEQSLKKTDNPANPFTKSRNDSLAPWTWYNTGWRSTDDVQTHAAAIHSVTHDRVVSAWKAVRESIKRQMTEFQARAEELRRAGAKDPVADAQKEKQFELSNRKTYDSWTNLDDRLASVERMIERLEAVGIDDDFDYTFARISGDVVGALVSTTVGTNRNMNGLYIARSLRQAGLGNFNSLLTALGFSTLEKVKVILSVYGLSAAKSIVWALRGAVLGVGRGIKEKSVRVFWNQMWRDVIKEMSHTSMMRLKSIRALVDAEKLFLPDRQKEFDNQMLGSFLHQGNIPSKDIGAIKKTAIGAAALVFETWVKPVLGSFMPMAGDMANNVTVHSIHTNPIFSPIASAERALKKFYADWKRGKFQQFDFANPRNPVNVFASNELGMHEWELNQVRRQFEMFGRSFDEEATKFLRDLDAGKNAKFDTDVIESWADSQVNQANRASASNQPLAFRDNNAFLRAMTPLLNFGVRQLANFNTLVNVAQQFTTPAKTQKEADQKRMRQWAYTVFLVVIPSLFLIGGAFKEDEDLEARVLKKFLYNQDSPNRLPWEEETLPGVATNIARSAFESLPVASVLANMVLPQNFPARASYDPSLVLVSQVGAIADYLNKSFASGDWTYGLQELAQRLVPDTKIVLNRLDSTEGTRQRDNVVALMKRYADPDLVRPAYKGGTPNVSELTPYVRQLQNAAMRGDQESFQKTWSEAVAVATKMGKLDPEKSVQQAFNARNPTVAALKVKQTPEQYAAMLAKMSPDERKTVEDSEKAFQTAASWVSIKPQSFAKTRATGSPTLKSVDSGGSSRAPSGTFGLAAPRRASVAGGISRIAGVSRARRASTRLTARSSRVRSRSPRRRTTVSRLRRR